MAKRMVTVGADLSGALAATGFIKGVAAEIETDKHMNSVMDVLFSDMNMEFLEYMDALAASDHRAFHHVYEWDMVGVPTGRLFKPVMRGRGRNRTVSWDWRASKKTVPLSPEAEAVDVKRIHVFVWKAPFMEYNTDGVTIEPQRHEWLSAFTRNNDHGLAPVKGKIHVNNPGGRFVQGSFSVAFAEWWGNGDAQMSFERRRKAIEKRLGDMPIAETARKSKGFSLAVGSANKLLAQGETAGRNYVKGMTKNYLAQAEQRLSFMGED